MRLTGKAARGRNLVKSFIISSKHELRAMNATLKHISMRANAEPCFESAGEVIRAHRRHARQRCQIKIAAKVAFDEVYHPCEAAIRNSAKRASFVSLRMAR